MPNQKVTLLTIAASAPLRTKGGRTDSPIPQRMVVGVKVGRSSEVFKHPHYNLLVDHDARPRPEEFEMPQLMAARLLAFVRSLLMPEDRDYSGFSFMMYVSGLVESPKQQAFENVPLDAWPVATVREMRPYFICSEAFRPLQAFIGLKGQRALSVLGFRGPLGITRVDELMQACGGAVITHITPRT